MLDSLRAISPGLQVERRICSDPAEIPEKVWRQVDVLHTNSVLPKRRDVPSLRLLQLDTSGIDHITSSDIWMESDVPVATIRGISARWMAEYVTMMILGFSHGMPEMLRLQRNHVWPSLEERWRKFGPAPLVGARVVVVGFGSIGRAIGDLCATLGMQVIGVRRGAQSVREATTAGAESPGPSDPATFPRGTIEEVSTDQLREVVADARYVVVVVPATPQTLLLINRTIIDAMSERTVLINVARGGIVDEEALAAALRNGRLGGAVLDVFAEEPLAPDSPLWDTPNLVISPHVSGFAGDYLPQVERLVTENLRRLMNDEPLLNLADRSVGY